MRVKVFLFFIDLLSKLFGVDCIIYGARFRCGGIKIDNKENTIIYKCVFKGEPV